VRRRGFWQWLKFTFAHYPGAMTETDADKFLNRAEECLQHAERAISTHDREEWLRLAEDIANEHAIIVRVLMFSNDRRAFVGPAVFDCSFMKSSDCLPVRCLKCALW
jgi:hypothetical protein